MTDKANDEYLLAVETVAQDLSGDLERAIEQAVALSRAVTKSEEDQQ